MRSKLQYGSVPRILCTAAPASPRSSRSPEPTRPVRKSLLARAAAPFTPRLVHFQGTSTSCVSATANRAPLHRGGSIPRRRRSLSTGGSSGSRHDDDARKRSCSSRVPFSSSRRARWKNASARSSPPGRSPRSTSSHASALYGTSSPSPRSRAPIVSSTQRARRSTSSGITGRRLVPPGPHGRDRA